MGVSLNYAYGTTTIGSAHASLLGVFSSLDSFSMSATVICTTHMQRKRDDFRIIKKYVKRSITHDRSNSSDAIYNPVALMLTWSYFGVVLRV